MRKNELYQTYVVKKPVEPVEPNANNRDEETTLINKEQSKMLETDEKQTFGEFIQSTLWPYMLSVFLVFAVTLGLFPGKGATSNV